MCSQDTSRNQETEINDAGINHHPSSYTTNGTSTDAFNKTTVDTCNGLGEEELTQLFAFGSQFDGFSGPQWTPDLGNDNDVDEPHPRDPGWSDLPPSMPPLLRFLTVSATEEPYSMLAKVQREMMGLGTASSLTTGTYAQIASGIFVNVADGREQPGSTNAPKTLARPREEAREIGRDTVSEGGGDHWCIRRVDVQSVVERRRTWPAWS